MCQILLLSQVPSSPGDTRLVPSHRSCRPGSDQAAGGKGALGWAEAEALAPALQGTCSRGALIGRRVLGWQELQSRGPAGSPPSGDVLLGGSRPSELARESHSPLLQVCWPLWMTSPRTSCPWLAVSGRHRQERGRRRGGADPGGALPQLLGRGSPLGVPETAPLLSPAWAPAALSGFLGAQPHLGLTKSSSPAPRCAVGIHAPGAELRAQPGWQLGLGGETWLGHGLAGTFSHGVPQGLRLRAVRTPAPGEQAPGHAASSALHSDPGCHPAVLSPLGT